LSFSIRLDIDADRFAADIKSAVETFESRTLQEVISGTIIDHYSRLLDAAVESKLILRYSQFKTIYSTEDWSALSLDELLKRNALGLETLMITVVVPLEHGGDVTFVAPEHLRWLNPHPSFGTNFDSPRSPELDLRSLKTVSRVSIKLFDTVFPCRLLRPAREAFSSTCSCQPDLLTPYLDRNKKKLLEFVCAVCGKIHFCECFRGAMRKWYEEALAIRDQYAPGSWPHLRCESYERAEFRKCICHLCRGIPSDLFYCAPMYGSEIRVRYGPYIERIAADEGMETKWRGGNMDQSEAENVLRDLLGVPRIGEGWLSEMELLRLVRAALPKESVKHQGSPEWLGRQRFDIFVPRLRLAIEYQGRQHFEPIEFFGGKTGLARTQVRDERKRELCEKNEFRLVYFRFDEDLTLSEVKSRLEAALRS
jgi:hypothetical protein